VIQVIAAPVVSWRGVFSVHTRIAVKPTGAPRFTHYAVFGFGVANGAPAMLIDRTGPDIYWFGAQPLILLDRCGVGVNEMIAQLRAGVANYPYPNTYRPWPGPNSNTFLPTSPNWDPPPLECGRQGFPAGRRLVRPGTPRIWLSGVA
jgi:hypothetical protein